MVKENKLYHSSLSIFLLDLLILMVSGRRVLSLEAAYQRITRCGEVN
jgi:hypothetical protein